MRINQITAGPDVLDVFVQNGTGTTISQGRPVNLLVGVSCDGTKVMPSTTLGLTAFLGVALKDIAANGNPGDKGHVVRKLGRVQVYMFATGTSTTVAPGVVIGPGVAASNGFGSGGQKNAAGPLVACDTIGASICSGGGLAWAYANMA